MESDFKQAKQNLKMQLRLRRLNGWVFGPVFLINTMALAVGVTHSEMSGYYQDKGFWQATHSLLLNLIQTILA